MAFLTIAHSEEFMRIAHHGPLVLTHYIGHPTMNALTHLEGVLDTATAAHGLTVSLTIVGQARFFRVDEEVRDRSLALARKFEKTEKGLGLVVTATGLAATVARTFLSGFFLLRKSPTPTQVFSTVAEGLRYVKARVPDVTMVQAVRLEDVEAFTSPA
jgi:hypothetical protein